jgi:hypothetical protein
MKPRIAASTDSATRVTQNWKELYGFSQGPKKLTGIIENQRRGFVPRRMTPLQHLGVKALGNSKRTTSCRTLSKPLPRPEPSTMTNNSTSNRGSQVDPPTTSIGTNWSDSSEVVNVFGKGMFDKFAFDKL